MTPKALPPPPAAPNLANLVMRPEVTAASIFEAWEKDGANLLELVDEVELQVQAVNKGDLSRAEAMLIAQAHSLNHIFAVLARRATTQTQLPHWEAYMRMAMRAQNQCRMTLETLSTLKNPPGAVFVRQANIANGPQQVNNGRPTPAAARTERSDIPPNELLEDQRHGSTPLDTGTAATTGPGHQTVGAVGKVNRPAKRRRQGHGVA